MSREIRKVPKGWEHPKAENSYVGRGSIYKPLYDKNYSDACAEWKTGFMAWENKTHKSRYDRNGVLEDYEFWDYDGPPPDSDWYRTGALVFKSEDATCFQVYETVTEGTPVSPVFETLDEVQAWLVSDYGYSEAGAAAFVKLGYVPSGIIFPGVGLLTGSDACEFLEKQQNA